MSGVQFIGLSMESLENKPVVSQVGYFLMSICCLVSLFGSTLSYILIKYLTSIRWESMEFILAGFHKYHVWFRFIEIIPYMTSGLFLITINLISFSQLSIYYSSVFISLSSILSLIVLIALIKFICSTQAYTKINEDDVTLYRIP